jgi:hypothetical protein
MTSNENLNSRDLRAQPQQGDTEIGGSSNSQTAQTAGQQNPTPAHNPSLLPESYLRANTLKPSHLGNRSSKDAEPNQEPGQSQQEGHGQSPGANPATDQAEEAGGKEARVPTLKRPEELPIDCTIQMRGRTLRNQDEQNQVPWEKSYQQEEPEEKILPLPVKPPPSATNNRLAAMQLPADSQMIQSQVEEAASSSFEAQSLDTTASRRQAVRYKPSAPSSSLKNTTSSGMSRQTENSRRAEAPSQPEAGLQGRQSEAPRRPVQRQNGTDEETTPRRNSQKQFYSEEDISPPARTRVNPNLLKSSGSGASGAHSRESDDDYSYKSSGEMPKLSWSEMSFLLKFYFREAKSLFINPYEFFLAHINDTTLGEPIAFMVISSGIAAIFMSLGGDIGGGLSILFGTGAYAIIAAIAVHYAMDFLNTSDAPKGKLVSTFKIMAYSQAPLLVAWIKLGVVPAGWWVAFVYSIFLCIVGLEQVYGMSRQKSMLLMIVVSLVVHGLLHMLGM